MISIVHQVWRNAVRLAVIAAFVLLHCSSTAATVTTVSIGCTTTQAGNAVINEVNTNANFIEVYLKQSANVSNWTLYVDNTLAKTLGAGQCTVNGTATLDNNSSSGGTTWPAGTFLNCPATLIPSNNEVLLSDSVAARTGPYQSNVIDYLSYGTPSPRAHWSVPAVCGTLYPAHDPSDKDIARLPDGSGSLVDNGNDSSPGTSNANTVSIANLTISEGDSGTMNASFTLTLSRIVASNVTVQYATSNGTATGASSCGALGVDFQNTSGTATILANTASATVNVPICGDASNEADETFSVTLSNPLPSTALYIGTGTATGTIVNDDPHRYEVALPSESINCLPTTVTVTACKDSTSPCVGLTGISGATATFTTSAGTLGSSPLTFDASGVASTTVSYPAASDPFSTATLTLSGESKPAQRQCCQGGTCTVSNTCATDFYSAGLIISGAASGTEASIPTQTAGIGSSTYYLRAIKSSTAASSTPAPTASCVAALPAGVHAVDWAYRCMNPSTCYAANLMSINAGTATTVQRNDSTGTLSYLPVNMTFDGNGNAAFTLAYSDVGEVKLAAKKTINSAVLLGERSNAFVVKPGGFVLSDIKQTVSPFLVNPAAASATDAKFVKAGESFSATVTAVTAAITPTPTPSFGRESVPEDVKLTHALVSPVGGSVGTFSNGTIAGGSFSGGVATLTNLVWDEVGILRLTPSIADADYLGAGNVTGTASANIGRFYPDHFETTLTQGCSAFTYSGQAFAVTVTAKNGLTPPATTLNYDGSASTSPNFAKELTLSAAASSGGAALSASLGTLALATKAFNQGVATQAVMTGTVSVTNGSTAVTGVGTAFTAQLTTADRLCFASGCYAIASIANDTALTLGANYAGTTTTGLGLGGFTFASRTTAPTNAFVRAVDTDTVSSASSVEGGTSIRSGRMRLNNAYGSDRLDLPVIMRSEYWTSGNNWQLNSADTCTNATVTFAAVGTDITANTCVLEAANNSGKGCATALGATQVNRGYLETGVTGVDSSGAAGFAGNFNLWLRKPSPSSTGAISIGATVPTWLQFPWTGSTPTNPTARATFGIYKSPLIYRRENF